MIYLIQSGEYKLVETKQNNKILYLDKGAYAWVEPYGIGEMLVLSDRKHKADYILSSGAYQLFSVKDEPELTDLEHLELDTGRGNWQGYLLPTGLPHEHKMRSRIIPTNETIMNNPAFMSRTDVLGELEAGMGAPRQFTTHEAKIMGERLGVDFEQVDLKRFRAGLERELEHDGRDFETNVMNEELPDHPVRLGHMEARASA
jgi:hypothetical protein